MCATNEEGEIIPEYSSVEMMSSCVDFTMRKQKLSQCVS